MDFWHYNKVVGIELNKNLGNTNTSNELSDLLISLVNIEEIDKDVKFLEPAVGTGSFYFSILNLLLSKGFDVAYIVENMIYAYDIDNNALDVLRGKLDSDYNYSCNENTKIKNKNFLTEDFGLLQFNYIITNPPYISNKNIQNDDIFENKSDYINYLNKHIDEDISKVSDIYMYFKIKSLNLLKEEGLSIFLCSDSWIDSNFGDVLKKYIFSKNYNLDLLLNSQIYPFFRDDTNAILTVISKSNKDTTKLINLRTSLSKFNPQSEIIYQLKKEELRSLFDNKDISNKRNALILFYDVYFKADNFFKKEENKFTIIEKDFVVENTSLTQSKMLSDNLLIENTNESIPLFWQIQARVNKLPNYKNSIEKDELSYAVKIEDVPSKFQKNIKSNNFYLSTIIDRYPLCFYVNGESFHISKYFSFEAKNKESNNLESIMRLLSVYSILDMELNLKEGTRKTLRKGECGLAKEISKKDLENIRIPKEIDFSDVKENIVSYSNKVIYNIENALLDDDYWTIQKHITEKLGLSYEDLITVVKELLFLYVLRMRHIEKITNFENYFNEILSRIEK